MQHTHAPPTDPPVGGSAQPWSQYGQPQTICYPQWVFQGGLFLPVYVPYPYPGPFSVPRPLDSQVDAAGKPTDNSQSQHSRPASDHSPPRAASTSRSQRQPPSTHPSHPPNPTPTHPSHSRRHRRQRERPETSTHTSVPTNNEHHARKQSKKTAPPTQLRQDPPGMCFLV